MKALRFARSFWTLALLVAAAASLPGCNLKDAPEDYTLDFQNPEIAENLDSLLVYGINQPAGDTLLILRWIRGEPFPEKAPYPPGLGKDFQLLAQGFHDGILVRQTRTLVTSGRAGPIAYERLLMAPDLADTLILLPLRLGDTAVMAPAWRQRPGWQAGEFQPEGTYAWKRNGKVLARDTVLNLPSLAWTDSGTYVFQCENGAGRDSMGFRLSLRHRIPSIMPISDYASTAGQTLSIKAKLTHSDALLYRWMRGNVLVTEDSVLSLRGMQASQAGAYRLEVRNASDTTESARSNAFRIHLVGRVAKWDAMQWDGDVWW